MCNFPNSNEQKQSNLIALSAKIECFSTTSTLNKQSLHLRRHPWQQAYDFLPAQNLFAELTNQ